MSKYQNQVLMVGWEYPPHNSGGLGVACEGMTQALAEQSTQIYFTLPYRFSQKLGHMKVITCQTTSEFLEAPPFHAYSQVLPCQRKLTSADLEDFSNLPQSEIEQRVNQYASQVLSQGQKLRNGYDLVHAHDWMSFPAAMKLQQKLHKPFIAHVHSTEFDRIPSGHGSHYIAHTEYMGLRQADKVIAVSHFTKKILMEKYFVDEKKIEVIHNGVSPVASLGEVPRFASRRPVIVFMGRLTAQKGAEYFLQLAKAVLRSIPDALFVVAGSGDQYHSLLFKNADQQLSASVLFTGFLRDHQKDVLLSRADVFVMPSLSEPFGLVALEAAQRGTPVIVSKNSGVREILKSAPEADFWDIEVMTNQIKSLLQDQNYRQQVIEGQNHDLENSTWGNAATQIKKVYDQVKKS